MRTLAFITLGAAVFATPALAQSSGYAAPDAYGFVIRGNNTGGARSVVIPRGATGADTYFSSSAVGGNAARPELAVPNGSAGGAGGGGAR